MINWTCNTCGKDLLLEKEVYDVGYEGKEICLECENKIFIADCAQTVGGKWLVNYYKPTHNFDDRPNHNVSFECDLCSKELIIEYTVYASLYARTRKCLTCM